MANIKSAAKRALQNERARARNTAATTALRTAEKRFLAAASGGKTGEAASEYRKLASAYDKAAKRGVVHRNTADRKKRTLRRAMKPAA